VHGKKCASFQHGCSASRWTIRSLEKRLLEDYGLLDATGSRHTTQPAHAGVGGHHTTVRPLFFIAYPQTRVPAPSMPGPCAVASGDRSSIHYPTAQNPASLSPRTRTQYLQIPNFSAPECPSLTLPSSTSRRPRRDMPQLEPKYNLKGTIPSNSC
jgi:hypothetical protein